MIRKLLVVLVFTVVAVSARAETDVKNIAGVSYRLTTAIDIAKSATGRINTRTGVPRSESISTPSWLMWQAPRKASTVRLMASLKGGYQFGQNGRHHASEPERLGHESDDVLELSLPGLDALLIKGLRVGARVSF